jgi:hypothetical protein
MQSLLWVLAAGFVGFGITATFAGRLRMRRTTMLIPYVVLTGAFLYSYVAWSGIDVAQLLADRWLWGVVGGAVVGALMVRNVTSQPSAPRPRGARLAFQIAWWGVIYGALDGLFLTVMPVLAAQRAFATLAWSATWYGEILTGIVALLASAYVTIAYHAGYPEFRNNTLLLPIAGNNIISLAYLLLENPLTAIIAHAVMHVAAVLHGSEGTVQLPPHHNRPSA